MQETYITLPVLAGRLGMDRSNTRKYANRKGAAWVRVRTPESRGQTTLAVTGEEADRLTAIRAQEGFTIGIGGGSSLSLPAVEDRGVFYIAQLVPDLAPNRIKVGFASDMSTRIAAHRTAAPTATVHAMWPCKRGWEPAAIAAVTADSCTWIGPEVFDCADISVVVARGHQFFALLPQLS